MAGCAGHDGIATMLATGDITIGMPVVTVSYTHLTLPTIYSV